jgi:peroxiredoxin
MIRKEPIMRIAVSLAVLAAIAAPALAAPRVGASAPAFTATDSNGKAVSLSQFRGKTVVLEWNNPGCPFVVKHYSSGNMQKTQGSAGAQGVVWLTVNSGAPGKQGHMDGAGANAYVAKGKAKPAAYLLDPSGVVGRAYAATTTPEVFVIDPRGTLVYKGAIDDKPTANAADIPGARNHALAALADMKAGRKVAVAETRSYGCAVKYAG